MPNFSRHLLIPAVLFIFSIAQAQWNFKTDPFMMPPGKAFNSPAYPTPSGQKDKILFPFYSGETTWTPPAGQPTLYTKYDFPVGTNIELLTNGLNNALTPNKNYKVKVKKLPRSHRRYSSRVRDREYYVSGKTLSEQKYLGNDQYSLKSNTSLYQSTPVQNLETTGSEARVGCTECNKNMAVSSGQLNILESTSLELVKLRVLKEGKVPAKAFNNAWNYFLKNQKTIRNQNYITVVDYSKPSTVPRLFLINLKTGEVESHMVSHGINSSGTGELSKYAVNYSNAEGTRKSSPGPFLTGETYIGKFGYSLKVDGQSSGVNSQARNRTIVIHPWNVFPGSARDTWGCFGLDPTVSKQIIDKTRNGSLWYVEPYSK